MARIKQIRLSPFHLDLMPEILAIELASFPEDPYDEELFRQYYERCPELFLVARRARKVAGYSITCASAKGAELVSIAVAPKHRRTGVAQALLDHTIERLSAAAVPRFSLMVRSTSEAAIGLYQRNGFTKVRTIRHYYEDGAAAIRMRRNL